MLNHFAKILALSFAVVSFQKVSFGKEFIFNYIKGNGEPYTILKGDKLEGGLLKDFGDTLGKRLGVSVTYRETARNRVETDLENGAVHVACMWNKAWAKKPDAFLWSDLLFVEENWYMMSKAHAFPLKSLDDLKGKKLGAIRGYFYDKELMEHFEKKTIQREDVNSLDQNFKKLEKGNVIDAFLDSSTLIQHYMKKNKLQDKFVKGEQIAGKHDIMCGLSQKSPVKLEEFNKVLAEMKAADEINTILAKYK